MMAPFILFQTTKTFDSHFIFFVSLTSWLMKEEILWALASKYNTFKIWPSLWPHSRFTIWFWENFIFLTTINSSIFFLFLSLSLLLLFLRSNIHKLLFHISVFIVFVHTQTLQYIYAELHRRKRSLCRMHKIFFLKSSNFYINAKKLNKKKSGLSASLTPSTLNSLRS